MRPVTLLSIPSGWSAKFDAIDARPACCLSTNVYTVRTSLSVSSLSPRRHLPNRALNRNHWPHCDQQVTISGRQMATERHSSGEARTGFDPAVRLFCVCASFCNVKSAFKLGIRTLHLDLGSTRRSDCCKRRRFVRRPKAAFELGSKFLG